MNKRDEKGDEQKREEEAAVLLGLGKMRLEIVRDLGATL